MKMEDALPAVRTGVDDDSVAFIGKTTLVRQLFGEHVDLSHDMGLIGLQIIDTGEMTAGDDEQMNRGLGIDVFESQIPIVLVYNLGRNLAGGNAAEQT
jgi:hypothetical protein